MFDKLILTQINNKQNFQFDFFWCISNYNDLLSVMFLVF